MRSNVKRTVPLFAREARFSRDDHGRSYAATWGGPYQQASAPVFEAERPLMTVRSEPDSYGRLTSPELLLRRDGLSSYLGI